MKWVWEGYVCKPLSSISLNISGIDSSTELFAVYKTSTGTYPAFIESFRSAGNVGVSWKNINSDLKNSFANYVISDAVIKTNGQIDCDKVAIVSNMLSGMYNFNSKYGEEFQTAATNLNTANPC